MRPRSCISAPDPTSSPHESGPDAACAGMPEPGAPEQQALAWWALQFSPRVCRVDEAVLLEVEASLRLFGGRRALWQRLQRDVSATDWPGGSVQAMAGASTALGALALLRSLPVQDAPACMACNARQLPARLDALPIDTLSAARPHAAVLARLGCHSLGALRALPRGGVSRRLGGAVLEALDQAYGLRPASYAWDSLPEQFSARLEFNGRVEVAQGLLFAAHRLLGQLAGWLQARQRGVLALVLHWEHDLVRRGDLAHGQLLLRTAEATRDVTHLARLLAEHLARVVLPAPVQAIRLEAVETSPWASPSASLLPDDAQAGPGQGETLQQCVERLSARLGSQRVLRGLLREDHRPQHMQRWLFADALPSAAALRAQRDATQALPASVRLQPPWILREPLRLAMLGERPVYQGPLVMLSGPERLESGWWSVLSAAEHEGEELALRDYYVARSPQAGLLWVYRRRSVGEPAWFLQGVYG